jgi:hypothetical protein
MTDGGTSPVEKDLDAIITGAEARMRREIDARGVKTARDADELAADIAGEVGVKHGFADDSDEADAIISALCKIAGVEFPGGWEDYPLDEERAA